MIKDKTTTGGAAAFRAFEIMQYEQNPLTGENLHFNEETILLALRHKVIKKWSYIRHDRDRKEDGSPKGAHWHVYVYCDHPQNIATMAKWFGVEPQYVEVKKGEGSFLDCTQYFTHELQTEKAQYPDESIHSNLPWRELLAKRSEDRKRYGSEDLKPRDKQRIDVLKFGKTLAECKAADPVLYVKEMQTLQRCRAEYLATRPAPLSRVNFYITGAGGIGKGQSSKALARALFPELQADEEIFFEVGGDGATFEGYDGQPVIIWNDFRAQELLWTLGSRSAVFNVFDTIPTNLRQNIKYSSVKLLNCVNIVNSVQPYAEFCDNLAGEYTDKSGIRYKAETDQKQQAYRRFPFALELTADDTTFVTSRGYVKHTDDFLTLDRVVVHGNARYINRYVKDPAKRRTLEQKLMALMIKHYKASMEYNKNESLKDEDAFFASFGEVYAYE